MNKRELKTLDLSNPYSGKSGQRLKMASYRLIKFQGRAVAAAIFFAGFLFMGAPEGQSANYDLGAGNVILGDENSTDATSDNNLVDGYDNTLVNDSDGNSVSGSVNFLNNSDVNEVNGEENTLTSSSSNQI